MRTAAGSVERNLLTQKPRQLKPVITKRPEHVEAESKPCEIQDDQPDRAWRGHETRELCSRNVGSVCPNSHQAPQERREDNLEAAHDMCERTEFQSDCERDGEYLSHDDKKDDHASPSRATRDGFVEGRNEQIYSHKVQNSKKGADRRNDITELRTIRFDELWWIDWFWKNIFHGLSIANRCILCKNACACLK